MIENKRNLFLKKVLEQLGINYIRTRPYSPWQNGVVKRSYKLDNDLFYRRRFKSESEIYKYFKRYSVRTNNICLTILEGFIKKYKKGIYIHLYKCYNLKVA